MTVNIPRGLFRLWIVLSLIYVAAVAALSWGTIQTQFEEALPAGFEIDDLPVLCSEARGILGEDYSTVRGTPGPWDKYTTPNSFQYCWYQRAVFRKLFPMYADLSEHDLTEKMYLRAGMTSPNRDPWGAVLQAIGIALVPPLLVFVIGGALIWAFSGFARRQP